MGTSTFDDCGQAASALLRQLQSPERNHYYYGKLLDAFHLELEQQYGNHKRWLLNRLTLGSGVLCGLGVQISEDGRQARVTPGVAIDAVGREIVVPAESVGIDVRQPTDACGRPVGPAVRGGEEVTLSICYHECEAEPVPAMGEPCGDVPACEYGLIRERYRLIISRGRPSDPSLISPDACGRIFGPLPEGTARRTLVCQTLAGTCDTAEPACVPLAVIRLDDQGQIVRPILQCESRRTIYSNAMLLDLILCLSRRVDECCGALKVRSLMIVSGDQQSAGVNAVLPAPLVVRVVEAGAPVANEAVTFEVAPGSGAIGPSAGALGASFATTTDAQGLATLPVWRLGAVPGAHTVTARITTGAPALVSFTARASQVAVKLPVVRHLWPATATTLDPQSPDPVVVRWTRLWMSSPRIELTFNVRMRDVHLAKPGAWLRVSLIRRFGQNEIEVRPLPVQHAGPAPQPVLGGPGEFTEVFALGGLRPDDLKGREAKFLVQIVAADGNIVDTSTPAQLLDADFQGTRMGAQRRREIFALSATKTFPDDVWNALGNVGAVLPQSGEGSEGGEFTAWYSTRF